ncbi:MAG: hypothetical protein AAF465_14310 [Pseudomonadota bacterium]
MESLIPLLISLVSGAAGGNLAGALMKKFSLGMLGNSLAGILGGGIGSQIIGMLGGGALDGIVGSIAGGGVGGGVLMVIIGLIKSAMNKA